MKQIQTKKIAKALSLAVLLVVPGLVSAQKAQNKNAPAASSTDAGFADKWSIGLNGGAVLFLGDVKQYDVGPITSDKNEIGYGAGLRLSRSFNYVFGVQADVNYGKLNGTYKPNKKYPNRTESIYFQGDYLNYSVSGVINLGNLVARRLGGTRKFTIYTSIGMGIGAFRAKLKTLKGDTLLIPTYGYDSKGATKRSYEIIIPIALGMKYRVAQSIDLGFESNLICTNTDRLDTRIAGNSFDKYWYNALTLTYKLGSHSDKDQWVNPLDGIPSSQDSLRTRMNQLSNDTDGDGVADLFDKEISTPAGVKTYGDGSTVDSDGDGVADYQDAEPFSSKGAKVDSQGREMDADSDGVPDSKDLEANTPVGTLVNFQGKKIAIDSVGSKPSIAVYLPSIYFGVNGASVQPKHFENLASVARTLKANPKVKLTIVGNTDAIGSDPNNDKLGMKRAKSVADHLVKTYGIDASRLVTESRGKKDPLAKTENSVNRRVDFIVQGGK